MRSYVLTWIKRAAAPLAITAFLVGIGSLGWLVGHIVTYDAAGQQSAHAAHTYMHPVERFGEVLTLTGFISSILIVGLMPHIVGRWLEQQLSKHSFVPWLAAAGIPVATFVGVELFSGASTMRGLGLLTYGVPTQITVGLAVLAITRLLVKTLCVVAVKLTKQKRRSCIRDNHFARLEPFPLILLWRNNPMATNAPLRAPPVLVP